MARGKKKETLTPEERLQATLVPESEQPYPVPENWCWTYLGCVSDVVTGGTPSKKHPEYYGGLFPFFKPTDLDFGRHVVEASEYLTDEGKMVSRIIPEQSTAVCCIGSIGKCGFLEVEGTTNQQINSAIPKFNPLFLYYYCNTHYFNEELWSKASATTISIVNKSKMESCVFPLPPLPEQLRIVDRIESLFAKLDEAKQKAQDALDSFETRKAAILHKAFTGELTAQWRKEHGVGMESWETHELVECFEIVSGIQKTPARSPRHNPIPYLAVANVYRNKIDLSDIRYFEVTPEEIEKLKLQDKDILIVEGNGSGKEIGRCAMWHNELPLCVHQNHIIRIRNKSPKILPEYVLYYLNSETGKSVMQERAKTTAGLFNLSAGKVKTIPLPFASLDEQAEIVHILDDLIAKEQQAKEAAEKVLEQIDLIKKSILARAFRGELGTNDPSEESAVELLKQVL